MNGLSIFSKIILSAAKSGRHSSEQLTLGLDHKIALGYDFFIERLERVHVFRAALLYHIYFAKAAAANDFHELKIVLVDFGLGRKQVFRWSFFFVLTFSYFHLGVFLFLIVVCLNTDGACKCARVN